MVLNPVILTAPKQKDTLGELLAYVLAPLGGVSGRTVADSLEAGLIVFSEMRGPGGSKPTYEAWTETLHAALACEWLLYADRERDLEWLEHINARGFTTFGGDNRIGVLVTPPLLHFLTGTVARLIGHLDRKIGGKAWRNIEQVV